MLRRLILAAAFLASPAIARAADWDNFNGQFVGDVDLNAAYVFPDSSTDGVGLGAGGNAVWRLGESNFHAQGTLHYSESFSGKDTFDILAASAEATGFWRWQDSGLLGFSGGYERLDNGHTIDADYFKAGVQGQIYGSDIVTFSAEGGIFIGKNGKGGNFDGFYLNGGVNYYLTDNLAMGIGGGFRDVDADSDDIFTMNFKGEYLMPTAMPVSMTMGYSYADLVGTPTHAAMIGFKMYFGGGEGDPLSTIHRSGSADSGNPAVPLLGY